MAGKRAAISTTYPIARDPNDQRLFTEFGNRLQKAMDAKGWSQSELSRRCTMVMPKAAKGQGQNIKFDRARISNYIRGYHMPRPEALAVLCRALHVSQESLLPAGFVPKMQAAPIFRREDLGDGKSMLQVNRVVPTKTAWKIEELLRKEEGV